MAENSRFSIDEMIGRKKKLNLASKEPSRTIQINKIDSRKCTWHAKKHKNDQLWYITQTGPTYKGGLIRRGVLYVGGSYT